MEKAESIKRRVLEDGNYELKDFDKVSEGNSEKLMSPKA